MIENPETVGEHLLNRRLVEGLAQHEVAQKLGVELWSVRAREAGRREPDVQSWPKILTFLGYDPNPPPTTMSEQIAAKRRQLVNDYRIGGVALFNIERLSMARAQLKGHPVASFG